MAKSARASVKKHNKTNLRHRVFAPVEQARNERLNAKLLELASQPKPEQPDQMDLEPASNKDKSAENDTEEAAEDGMEIDGDTEAVKKVRPTGISKKVARVQKRRRGKATSTIVFPKFEKGRKVSTSTKKKSKR